MLPEINNNDCGYTDIPTYFIDLVANFIKAELGYDNQASHTMNHCMNTHGYVECPISCPRQCRKIRKPSSSKDPYQRMLDVESRRLKARKNSDLNQRGERYTQIENNGENNFPDLVSHHSPIQPLAYEKDHIKDIKIGFDHRYTNVAEELSYAKSVEPKNNKDTSYQNRPSKEAFKPNASKQKSQDLPATLILRTEKIEYNPMRRFLSFDFNEETTIEEAIEASPELILQHGSSRYLLDEETKKEKEEKIKKQAKIRQWKLNFKRRKREEDERSRLKKKKTHF